MEDAFRVQHGGAKERLLPGLKVRRRHLACRGPGVQGALPSLSGCSSHLTCSHLAYSQACWGSGKGPRQG